MKKLAVISGGYSEESVISAKSAATVIEALKNAPYEVYELWIDQNEWYLKSGERKFPIDKNDFSVSIDGDVIRFDAVFNTIHGSPGENGLLQGYFDMIGIPYNNCDVFVSSLTFHKAACNRYLRSFGIESAESVILGEGDSYDVDAIISQVGLPCFVKPNQAGSSLGISKVNKKEELHEAIRFAFEEDNLVLIERFLDGTEVTCGAWSKHGKAVAIAVTEIVAEQEFFDYHAKYHDEGTQEITPARITDAEYQNIMKLTEEIYRILNCRGVIRVDYVLESGHPKLIEVNTTPGLSSRSLIPQQAEYAGLKLSEFFTEQIQHLIGV